jgi:hypothetical protein
MGDDGDGEPRGSCEVNLSETLIDLWRQVLDAGLSEVKVGDRLIRVERTRARGLRTVAFEFGEHAIEGIEQNPDKPSRWGQLASEGKRIMQFSSKHRYFANVCEGALTRYPMWKGLGLPD